MGYGFCLAQGLVKAGYPGRVWLKAGVRPSYKNALIKKGPVAQKIEQQAPKSYDHIMLSVSRQGSTLRQ